MHPVEQYIDDVVNNRILTCHWVQRAVARHLHDLTHGAERGLYFDEEAAQIVLDFFPLLCHSKGDKTKA